MKQLSFYERFSVAFDFRCTVYAICYLLSNELLNSSVNRQMYATSLKTWIWQVIKLSTNLNLLLTSNKTFQQPQTFGTTSNPVIVNLVTPDFPPKTKHVRLLSAINAVRLNQKLVNLNNVDSNVHSYGLLFNSSNIQHAVALYLW